MTVTEDTLIQQLIAGDEDDRCEAAKLLSDAGEGETTNRLIALLRSSLDNRVRRWVVYALGFRGDVSAKPALIEALLDDDNDLDVRCHAAEALGHLYLRSGHEDAREALRTMLTHDSAELRFWAAFALGNNGVIADIRRLQPLLDDHREVPGWWSVAREAAESIERIRDRRSFTGRHHGLQ